MASVDEHAPIWHLSIPGTHDSYTASIAAHGPSYQTQTLPVPQQLKMGIRALDLRLRACEKSCSNKLAGLPDTNDDFNVVHANAKTGITLSGVLEQLRSFLHNHPTEFIILRAKVDPGYEGTNFERNFNAILHKYTGILWIGRGHPTGAYEVSPTGRIRPVFSRGVHFEDPDLFQVRGKVVLLKDFPTTPAGINPYGMKWDTEGFHIQDDWYMTTNWSLWPKWEKVLSNWTQAVDSAGPPPFYGPSRAFVNFLTGNGGSFPYFVASGRSSENGPPLLTGRVVTTNNDTTYPDFHRTGCALGLCSVAFTGTNLLMYDVLSNQNEAGPRHAHLRHRIGMGVIYLDFPGQPLVNAIIANNVYCPPRQAADASHNRLTPEGAVATASSAPRFQSHFPFVKRCPSPHPPPPAVTG